MKVPSSMREELGAWNDGSGIDLEAWVGCEGSFSLAVGYTSVFWPTFVIFEDYILREGFDLEALRGFEESLSGNKRGVETVMNHLHLLDIHHLGCEDLTADKAEMLGETLTSIYKAKLAYDFPDRPCRVDFHQPEEAEDLEEFEISFFQLKH